MESSKQTTLTSLATLSQKPIPLSSQRPQISLSFFTSTTGFDDAIFVQLKTIPIIRMMLVDGVLGWFYEGNGAGLGSNFEGPLATSKATHVSKFVEFYKSVSSVCNSFNLILMFMCTAECWRVGR